MDRRGFLKSLLGVAAGAALPKVALEFVASNASLTDAAFRDRAIIDLIALRIQAANEAFGRIMAADIFNNGTDGGTALEELVNGHA